VKGPILFVHYQHALSFQATSKRPVVLVGSGAEKLARSIVCLDVSEVQFADIYLNVADQLLHPTCDSVPAWRAAVSYVSLGDSGLFEMHSSVVTPLAVALEARTYAARSQESRTVSRQLLQGRLQAFVQRLGLHRSVVHAPYKDMTVAEKSLVAIAIALAFQPKALVLYGELSDFADIDTAIVIRVISQEGLPLVWANCGETCKDRLAKVGADVVLVDSKDGFVSSNWRDSKRPLRKWPEHRSGLSSSTFTNICAVGGALAAVAAPVLADVSERLIHARQEAQHASTGTAVMNDVHLWQLLAASFAILAVIVGQWRLGIGLSKELAIAATRCTLQLNLLGYLLVPVFERDSPWLVLAFLCFMLLVAAQEGTKPAAVFETAFWNPSSV
jgi:Uncharacterised protein family (UPF0014)